MLRLSKLTDYAIVILAYLATQPLQSANAKNIAQKTGISLPTTIKLLKRLTQEHVLRTHRGIKGGYQLAISPAAIPLQKIIQALEGQIALTACSHTNHPCLIEKNCTIRDSWRKINIFIQDILLKISIADLLQPRKLEAVLQQKIVLENA
jgi:FeS assembly SUF system regulator